MNTVEISGRFINENREPYIGLIRFVPSKIWVEEGEMAYATLAPDAVLEDGKFTVQVTDVGEEHLWHYTVYSPVGRFTIYPHGDKLLLKDLLPKRYA